MREWIQTSKDWMCTVQNQSNSTKQTHDLTCRSTHTEGKKNAWVKGHNRNIYTSTKRVTLHCTTKQVTSEMRKPNKNKNAFYASLDSILTQADVNDFRRGEKIMHTRAEGKKKRIGEACQV